VGWKSPALIAEEDSLADRASVYRHAYALGLVEKRKRNLRAALERIVEKAGEVEIRAAAVVAAVQAYAKINAAGQWIDRSEQVNMNDLFERMTRAELEAYARDGELPDWFTL
jgi:ParB-like chromosome segregation protein Spo0J